MRASAWIAAAAIVVAGCGDNYTLGPDAFVPQCDDGIDNDGDGTKDFPDDLSCDNAAEDSEDGPAMPKCSDNRDNDGDGKLDYPNDPGCVAEVGDDETDDCPNGPGCPQCGNGQDDDGNGMTDYPADLGCRSAGDMIEFIDDPTACGQTLTIKQLPMLGTDTGALDGSSISGVASACGGGGGAPAIAYVFYLPRPRVMVATTDLPGTTMDTVLDLRSADCDAATSSIACNDDVGGIMNKASRLVASLPAGTYYLVVEGYDASALGMYAIEVDFFLGEGLVCRIPLGMTQMVCSDPVCSDGLDDDTDTKTDYPLDPGCASPTDDTEDDDCPSGPMCPDCADGVDNDGDGQTDYPADTSCSAASGAIESCQGEEDPVVSIIGGTTMGTTVGSHDNHDPSCGGDGGLDVLFTLNLPHMRTITVDTENSSFDTLLSLLNSTCMEPSIQCDDDSGTTGNNSLITRTNLAAGLYIVAVDAYSSSTTPGPFDVHVAGTIEIGGRCDPEFTLGGALACPATSPCEGVAGMMRCRPTLCIDGLDNDADGDIDYPNDPGCASIDDDTELDDCPSGPNCPDCADGVDNDGDGMTDYPQDTACIAASGAIESCQGEEDPVVAIATGTTMGTTVGAHDNHNPSCGLDGGLDLVFTINLPHMETVTFDTVGSSFDTLLSLMNSTCTEPSIECNDDSGGSGTSLITRTNLAEGAYILAVDAYSTAQTPGPFNVHVSGVIAAGGRCDPPFTLGGSLACPATNPCVGPAGMMRCQPFLCADGLDNDSDGKIDFPNEPGCTSTSDDDESDICPTMPMNPACPACGNGLDDDTDTTTDFPSDFGCSSASGTTEVFCSVDPDFAGQITMPITMGTLAAPAADNYEQGCQSDTGNDVVHALVLPVPVVTLVVSTDGSVIADSVLSVNDASCTMQLACDDDGGAGFLSMVTLANVAAGNYAIQVDSYTQNGNNGMYRLNVNGTVAAGTACTSPLFASGVLACPTGTSCTGGTCQ
jgi:hypothetical protein